jgi:hypothetical protein
MAVGRTAVLRMAGAEPVEVELMDLTRNGCRIMVECELAPGNAVVLGIAGIGSIDGRVVWHGANGYGCRFDRELPAGSVTAAVRENVVRLGDGSMAIPDEAPPTSKYSPRTRSVILTLYCVLPWIAIGAGLMLLS